MGVAKSCLNLKYKPEIVTSLDFSRSQLEEVPANIFDFECTLEYLDLSSNSIADLPRHIFLCTSLKTLNISDNQLREIPDAISSLKELVNLNVAKNEISTIPSSISSCSKLQYLDLSSSFITSIPDNSITNLIHLVELCLNDVYLEFLPANIGKLTNLQNLELRCNRMESLPLTLSKLKKLENLDIGANEFEEFPSVIGDLQNLKSLHIDENEIRKIPSAIGKLTAIEFLNADENKISEIDPSIGNCISLKEIHMEKNLLTQLPDSICSCSNLERLKISRNCLTDLPNNIFEMKSIFELSVEHNSLQRLPNTIGILRNLNHLSLDYNYLKEIPDEICSCSSLRVLSFRENFVSNLPANIGQLKQLKILNVINNNLTYLPLSINNILNNLKALWLSDQQIKPLPSLQMIQSSDGTLNVLTCFMLPQSKFQNKGNEQGKVETAKQYNTDSMVRKKLLRFEKDVEDRLTTVSKKEKVDKNKHSLNRSPTPHPSELKKMASTAHHIASGTAQLKKTGGKTYRSYGKIDDVAVKSGELRGPVDFEIKEARVIDYLNEIDAIYSGKYSSDFNSKIEGTKSSYNVTNNIDTPDNGFTQETQSLHAPVLTSYTNEMAGNYSFHQEINETHSFTEDIRQSNITRLQEYNISGGARIPSPTNSNSYFKDAQNASSIYQSVSINESIRNDNNVYDTNSIYSQNGTSVANNTKLKPYVNGNRPPYIEKPSTPRVPPPYQEACKYSKLTDADFLIYDSIRNLQKNNLAKVENVAKTLETGTSTSTTNAMNSDKTDPVQTTGNGEPDKNGNFNNEDQLTNSLNQLNLTTEINGNHSSISSLSKTSNEVNVYKNELINNYTITPTQVGNSFALMENQATKELSVVVSNDSDEFPLPPSPLPSVKESLNSDGLNNYRFDYNTSLTPTKNSANAKPKNLPQPSPTVSNHSIVSNVSSSNPNKKKWAFGYHKNVSVSEVTIEKKDYVPFKIFQKTNQGIFIKTVDPQLMKQLQVNDKILECNGIDFVNISIESANSILNQYINETDLKLMISR